MLLLQTHCHSCFMDTKFKSLYLEPSSEKEILKQQNIYSPLICRKFLATDY